MICLLFFDTSNKSIVIWVFSILFRVGFIHVTRENFIFFSSFSYFYLFEQWLYKYLCLCKEINRGKSAAATARTRKKNRCKNSSKCSLCIDGGCSFFFHSFVHVCLMLPEEYIELGLMIDVSVYIVLHVCICMYINRCHHEMKINKKSARVATVFFFSLIFFFPLHFPGFWGPLSDPILSAHLYESLILYVFIERA